MEIPDEAKDLLLVDKTAVLAGIAEGDKGEGCFYSQFELLLLHP